MRQLLSKRLKNQKGLTLIELLAVIVILGIIAAIAVPSIGGIIDNTKKDAHIANAEQMVSSVKLAMASRVEPKSNTATEIVYTLSDLVTANLIENPNPPSSATQYHQNSSNVTYTKSDNSYKVSLGKVNTTKYYIQDQPIESLRASNGRTLVNLEAQ